ncbi:uncharacterized protein LOC126735623 isoform X2 [Anthonomus grandis grandis]|uniref:uncharacterized protein LOC126735623 isoform X2 n=1 Tax=Anthonomus grandis grandis TaxID=2921223 RepID=UPI002165CF75|nr:uncharacterized protein LOC126735623 isoform X2 [Anthonomus grandis grandis]
MQLYILKLTLLFLSFIQVVNNSSSVENNGSHEVFDDVADFADITEGQQKEQRFEKANDLSPRYSISKENSERQFSSKKQRSYDRSIDESALNEKVINIGGRKVDSPDRFYPLDIKQTAKVVKIPQRTLRLKIYHKNQQNNREQMLNHNEESKFDNFQVSGSTKDTHEKCNYDDDLFAIPLFESAVINRLLEHKNFESLPIKYVVKSVIPNYEKVDKLDRPDMQKCLRTYLQRKKRELKLLKKRKTTKKRKKNKHKRKKKKKKQQKKKNRKVRRKRQDKLIKNNNTEAQISNMIGYIDKNQSFNESFTFMPLFFGTVTKADGKILLAGIRQNASEDEALVLHKILHIDPDHLESAIGTSSHTDESKIILGSVSLEIATAALTPGTTPPTSGDPVKYNLSMNLNSPEVKQKLEEVMQRQQNIKGYETTHKVKREASGIASSSSMQSTAGSIRSFSVEKETLGLVVPSPSPNEASIMPGILIYAKSAKQKKRFAKYDVDAIGVIDSAADILNQNDINTIMRSAKDQPKIQAVHHLSAHYFLQTLNLRY